MKNLDKYCNSEDRLACRTNLTCSAVLSSGAPAPAGRGATGARSRAGHEDDHCAVTLCFLTAMNA